MGILAKSPGVLYDGATSLVDLIKRQFGDDIDGATQELVRMGGFPESVARRIATGELPMDEASRVARREARYADEGLVHVNRGGIQGEGFDNSRLPWDDPDTPFNAHWFTTDPHPTTAFRKQGSDDPLTYTPVVLEKGRRGDWRDVVKYGESMGEEAGYGTEFREGLLNNGVSDLVVRGGDKIEQSTIDALPVGGRLKVDPDNKYGDRKNSLVKNEDGSLGFYEGSEHILDYDDLADYQRFNPEIQDVAVLDNTIIRSPNAAFDPEYTGSNIMGGLLAGGVGLGALGQSEVADASVASLARRGLNIVTEPSHLDGSLFSVRKADGTEVAHADMGDDLNGGLSARYMEVEPEHRGSGIMNETYDAIEEMSGKGVTPSYWLTEDGVKFWVKRNRNLIDELYNNGDFSWDRATEDAVERALQNSEYTGSNIMGGALAAAGVMAAGQSEDADAGFITKGGKTLLEAWHGSPHKFDKFSMDQIGTGEGAQAYGHGLYFADSEDVARGYRDRLSGDSASMYGGLDIKWNGQEVPEAYREAASYLNDPLVMGEAKTNDAAGLAGVLESISGYEDSAKWLRDNSDKITATPSGNLYRTEIDVTPESLLDWDKPLSEQSEAFMGFIDENPKWFPSAPESYGNMRGEEFYKTLTERLDDNMSDVTPLLSERGIKGIKYLDGDSRAVGDGTSNYVIFDDSLINIAERGNADPRLLAGTAAGAAGLLAAPMVKDSGMISAPRSETLFDLTMGARDLERRLEGSPASLLFPSGLVEYLETVNRREEDPNAMTRGMALLDVLPF